MNYSLVTQLRTLVLLIWAAINPDAPSTHDAPVIADAIAVAAAEDAARGYADAPLEASLLAVYAWAESRNSLHPPPTSWDARAGVSCATWQLRCEWIRNASPVDQARLWLRLLHESSLASLDSDPRRALRRLRKAQSLLEYATAEMPR